MKKFKIICLSQALLLLCIFIPFATANANEIITSEKTLQEYHFVHSLNDTIPVQAIAVDDAIQPNIQPIPIPKVRMTTSTTINTSKDTTDYYQSWGRTNLLKTNDGADKVTLYDTFASKFANSSNITAVQSSQYPDYYIMFTFSLDSITLTLDDAVAAYSTFKNDHPEYYWLHYTLLYYPNGDYANAISIVTTSDYDTPTERSACDAKIKDTISEYQSLVFGLTSNYEIAEAVHNKIITDIDYLYDSDNKPSTKLYAHNIVGILDGTGGVCEGYAKAYQYLLNMFDVPNIYITGLADTGGNRGGHAWNMVMADNDYFYYVDATWDDYGAIPYYNYFMKGSEIFKNEHTPNTPTEVGFDYLYPLPTVPTADYTINTNPTSTSISNMNCTISGSPWIYDGTQKKPKVTLPGLILGTDFKVSYTNNTNAGTAKISITGIGNYNGSIIKTFVINKANLTGIKATGATTVYDGNYRTITITAPKDTTITYSTNNINFSSTKPAFKVAGEYKVYYRINKPNYNSVTGNALVKISKKSITPFAATLSATSITYKTTAIAPTITLKDGLKTLTKGTDYNVTYSNNILPGTATVTINGIGNYSSTIKKTFIIKMGVPSVKLTAGSKKATITWSKVTGASGYEVTMSSSSSGKYTSIKNAASTTTSYTKTKLKKGKTYYFKVVAYKTVNGKKIYGASVIKSIKVK